MTLYFSVVEGHIILNNSSPNTLQIFLWDYVSVLYQKDKCMSLTLCALCYVSLPKLFEALIYFALVLGSAEAYNFNVPLIFDSTCEKIIQLCFNAIN